MSVFPIKATLGRTQYEIDRLRGGMLFLKRLNGDGEAIIYFPETMIFDLAKNIMRVNLKYTADLALARMFRSDEPLWPNDLFDENEDQDDV